MKSQKSYSRKDRVVELVRRELALIIERELKDPRIGMISLTDLEITADYAHAKVFYSSLADAEQLPIIQKTLEQAAGFLRRELGREIRIHTIPQLRFIYDGSLAHGAALTRLIAQANALSGVDESPEEENTDEGQ